jgi:hypothetical protein
MSGLFLKGTFPGANRLRQLPGAAITRPPLERGKEKLGFLEKPGFCQAGARGFWNRL